MIHLVEKPAPSSQRLTGPPTGSRNCEYTMYKHYSK